MPYRVTLPGGASFLTEDLTLDEAVRVEEETGESWLYLNPIRSAKHARAILTAFAQREGSADSIGAMSVTQILECIVATEDDRPAEHENGVPILDPKAASAEPETTS